MLQFKAKTQIQTRINLMGTTKLHKHMKEVKIYSRLNPMLK